MENSLELYLHLEKKKFIVINSQLLMGKIDELVEATQIIPYHIIYIETIL